MWNSTAGGTRFSSSSVHGFFYIFSVLLIFSSCPEAQENEHRVAVFLCIVREVRFESPFLFALCSSGTVLLASRVSSFRRRSISAAEWLCCDAATFTRLATFIVSFDASSPSQSTLLSKLSSLHFFLFHGLSFAAYFFKPPNNDHENNCVVCKMLLLLA